MSGHKDWGNNERIHRDEHFKGIKSVIENEHLWIMKFLVVVLMYYGNVNENMEWMNSENLAKWTCVVCSEAGVPCRISIVCSEVGVRYQIYVVCNKSGVRCRICVVRNKSAFAAEILLSTTNWCSLSEVCYLLQIRIRCQNYVIRSESTSLPKFYVICSGSAFAVEIV